MGTEVELVRSEPLRRVHTLVQQRAPSTGSDARTWAASHTAFAVSIAEPLYCVRPATRLYDTHSAVTPLCTPMRTRRPPKTRTAPGTWRGLVGEEQAAAVASACEADVLEGLVRAPAGDLTGEVAWGQA